jgi:bacteriorhodopsin
MFVTLIGRLPSISPFAAYVSTIRLITHRFITTPLLLLDLLLTAGSPWPSILWTIFLDLVMVITGLVGALVKTRYKWGMSNPSLTPQTSVD